MDFVNTVTLLLLRQNGCEMISLVVQHGFGEHMPLMSVNGTTNQQVAASLQARTSSSLPAKCASHSDAVPPVWCSTANDLVNADDFRLAVMKNDVKLIETFLKHGQSSTCCICFFYYTVCFRYST